MTMSSHAMGDTERLEIASDWLLRIQANPLEPEELSEWLQWYGADPANRAAFEKMQEAFESIHAMSTEKRVDWAELLRAQGKQRSEDGHRDLRERIDAPGLTGWFDRLRLSTWIGKHRGLVGAGAMALVFALGISAWRLQEASEPVSTAAFKTERAVHRLVSLPDGSNVRLGAKSQLFTNFTPQTRYLVLEGGEAFFEVAKDAQRPFIVQAGSVSVRAVGTEFNVRRVNDQTVVAVAEGIVEVVQETGVSPAEVGDVALAGASRPLRVAAGEQITIGPVLASVSVHHVEMNAVGSWRDGRLEFVDESLGAVIGTINRYSPREVVITDRGLNDLRFTGTVSRDRIDEWLAALPDVFPVDVKRAGNEAVLISRPSSP